MLINPQLHESIDGGVLHYVQQLVVFAEKAGFDVSLVKIGAMATVLLGVSFWAYIAFAICFIATLTNLDRVLMWRRIEALQT